MKLDPDYLTTLAETTEFQPASLEKVVRLGNLVAQLSVHAFLNQVLVLKGGTAINLCFSEPRRLSVDLDFNYVGRQDRAGMLEQRPLVERAVRQLVSGAGYRVQQSADEHAGRKLYLQFRNAYGTMDRIELDLNFLHRVPLGSVEERSLWQPGGLTAANVRVVAGEELWAGKLCALLARSAPRDLWDAARLPEQARETWGSDRFHRIFVAFAGTLDHPLHAYGPDRLDRVTEATVVEQLHPVLRASDRPTAAELRSAAWSVVGPMVELDSAEREYTDLLQQGTLRPELLFPDDEEMATRVSQHPALRWKAKNAGVNGGGGSG
jgi:predicted nucleotidyltransferase component of viral defense system